MAKDKFPKEILVTLEKERNEDPFFLVHEEGIESLDYNEVDKQVAIYKLVEVKTLDVSVKLK